jgi:hypothetical protein
LPGSRRIDAIVLVGLAVWIGFLCIREYRPYTFIFRDGSFYAQTNRSIAQDFTLRQEAFQPVSWYDGRLPWYQEVDDAWSNVSVGADGEWYPKHSYLLPVFSTPFYVLFGLPGLLAFNGLAMILALFAGYRLASRFARPEAAAVAMFGLVGTPLVPYLAYCYSHDVFYAALVTGGCACLAWKRPLAGGFLLGLAVYAKVTNLIIAVPMAVGLTWRDWKSLGKAAAAGTVPLLVYAMANTVMYGGPLTTSYDRILTVHRGQPVVESLRDAFTTPLLTGLKRFFDRSQEGEVAQLALLPILAYAGAVPLLRRAPAVAIALLVSIAAFFFVFAKFQFGGARFVMPWLAMAVLPLAAILELAGDGWAALAGRLQRVASVRKWILPVSAGIFAVAVIGVWGFRAGLPARAALSSDVERLVVTLDGNACDYFNLTHLKWECSHLDRGGDYFVGTPLQDECAFAGRPMIWLPPDPGGKVRAVEWSPRQPASKVRLSWGLDRRSPAASVPISVEVGGSEVVRLSPNRPGVLDSRDVEVPSGPIRIVIPPVSRKDLFLCLDIEALQD